MKTPSRTSILATSTSTPARDLDLDKSDSLRESRMVPSVTTTTNPSLSDGTLTARSALTDPIIRAVTSQPYLTSRTYRWPSAGRAEESSPPIAVWPPTGFYKESPARAGRRLAQEALPKTFSFTENKVRKTISKRISNHVQLPRAQGSMHFKFSMDLVPMHGLKAMAEAAGLEVQPVKRIGGMRKIIRKWKTQGPSATAKFCNLQGVHRLAWGGAKLKAPAKKATRPVARVMTLVAPPFTATSTVTNDEESATLEGYLVTFNEKGEMTYPPDHEELWGEATESTKRVLKKYARRMLGDMYVEGLPVSQTFKKNLGPQFCSSEEEDASD